MGLENLVKKSGRGKLLYESLCGFYPINVLRVASNVADTETVTIGGDVYEFDRADNGVTAGRIAVTGHSDDTPTNAIAALATAINASGTKGYKVAETATNTLIIRGKEPTALTLACTETLAGANNVWAAAAMFGGSSPSARAFSSRVPTQTEIDLGLMYFFPTLTLPGAVTVRVYTTSGFASVIWDGVIVQNTTSNFVSISNAGSVDWATTSTVHVSIG